MDIQQAFINEHTVIQQFEEKMSSWWLCHILLQNTISTTAFLTSNYTSLNYNSLHTWLHLKLCTTIKSVTTI